MMAGTRLAGALIVMATLLTARAAPAAQANVAVAANFTDAAKEIAAAFKDAYLILQRRIELFAALPAKSLDHIALKRHLDAIGGHAG